MSTSSSEYITLAQASELLPGRPAIQTLHRWRLRGLRHPSRIGEFVRLRTQLVGGRRCTTKEWLDEFIAAINDEPSDESGSSAELITSTNRENDVEEARQRLRDEGVMA